jgi:hypothetical protein
MRNCPFTDCGARLDDSIFACGEHWRRLSFVQKQAIHKAYAAYKADEIGIEQLRAVQGQVIKAVEGGRRLF